MKSSKKTKVYQEDPLFKDALFSPKKALELAIKYKTPIPELEHLISIDPEFATTYAIVILNSRFLQGEPTIFQNPTQTARYISNFFYPNVSPCLELIVCIDEDAFLEYTSLLTNKAICQSNVSKILNPENSLFIPLLVLPTLKMSKSTLHKVPIYNRFKLLQFFKKQILPAFIRNIEKNIDASDESITALERLWEKAASSLASDLGG